LLLLFFFSFAKIKFSGNFLDDLHFGYIAKSFKKKPWLEGGGPKKHKNEKGIRWGCWLLTEQLRPVSLRGSEEEEEEERSLAPSLARSTLSRCCLR
jgi:hypothetical protein